MTRPKAYQTEAIVLNRHRFGEADQLLVLFTPHRGKLRAVAKGALRPKSKLGGHLEPLCHSLLMLSEGRNLDTISQCQTINSFLPLREDLWRTSCALYAVEMVDHFSAENQENYALYKLLLNTLERLCQSSPPQKDQIAIRYFELHFLNCTGYRPELQVCLNCRQPLEPVTNYFSISGGGTLCPLCRHSEPLAQPLSVNVLKVLRYFQQSNYSKAIRLRLDPQLQQELERIMRSYINYLLEYKIKSATWMDRMSRQL